MLDSTPTDLASNAFSLANRYVDTSATFDFATGEQTNRAFGSGGVRASSNRVIQLGIRLTF